jgi:hypothetical protein
MRTARSKLKAPGKTSAPADVRLGTFTSEDIHRAIFRGRKPKKRTIEEMDQGIAE